MNYLIESIILSHKLKKLKSLNICFFWKIIAINPHFITKSKEWAWDFHKKYEKYYYFFYFNK